MMKNRQPRLVLWLVGLMWVLPFLSFRHQLPIPSFYGELIAAALGLASMALLLRKQDWQPFALPRIALLPLGLVGLVLLQLVLGMIAFPPQALLGMLYLLWAMLLVVVGARLRAELGWETSAVTLAWFLLAGGLLSALVSLIQIAGVQGLLFVPKRIAQSYGNLGQSNHFADYMALALASLLYLRAKGSVALPVFVCVAVLFVGMLALSGSRSAWLYLLAMTFLAAVQWRASGQRLLLLNCLVLLPVFFLVQQLIPLLPGLSNGSVLMPTERLFREVSGVSIRMQIWQLAWHMFMDAPWLGVGFGQFDWNTFALAGQVPGVVIEPVEHAHNLILHLLAEMGLFAGVLAIGMLLAWGMRMASTPRTLEWWWALALLAVIGIHSLLEYPLWYTYFLGIASVLLGAGESRMIGLALGRVGRPAVAAILLLGTMGLVNLAQAYATLEGWMQRGVQGLVKDSDLPAMTRDLLRVHKESLLSPYVELVFATSIEPSTQLLDEKLQLSEQAMRFSPIRDVVYRHALLLAIKGDRPAALVQLRRAMRAYPDDIPGFTRALRGMIAKSPGVYEFLLNEMALQAKE